MVIVLGAMVAPVIVSASPDRVGAVTISLGFQWIRQGDAGIVRVAGQGVAEVRAVFQDRVFYFYPDKLGFVGVISADMAADVGQYTMQVWVNYADGTAEVIDQEVEVNYGEFGRSDVILSPSLSRLLEPDIEEAETERLFNLLGRFTPERYWEPSGFIEASTGEEIGFFGAWRLYNETYWRRHSGLDIRMPPGTPVIAVSDGRVILVADLAVRGNYILIDHGWGIYSGYAHLSEKLVVPGQWVRQGDVIGLSGSTGRSSGAHLHWEMAVGGAWVDPEEFVALGLGEDG
jgi:hypothetical protein